jgi:uncharacterized protein (DUF1778 family)
MTSSNGKTPVAALSASPAVPTNESNRTKFIATRLTDAEFAEIESAAASAGKKVAEWLREAALAQARATGEEKATDTVLLAEVMALRSLIVNLFAVASKGPLSDETLRKIAAYADATKDQKTEELLARKHVPKTPGSGEK